MKKTIVIVVVVAALVGGYFWLRNTQLSIGVLDPEFSNVRRGDLVIPIKASGRIEPQGRREIKSKASGEIIAMPFNVGEMVRQGDVLVALKRDDEQRNLDAAKAALDQANISLDTAKITKRQREEVDLPKAQAALTRAKAQFAQVEVEYQFKKKIREEATDPDEIVSPEEWSLIQAKWEEADALVKSAKADVDMANIAIKLAEKEIDRAHSAVVTAERKYQDAQERLDETEVRSPIDGMIVTKYRNVGEMIQSGTQSLTGGTVLMEVADVDQVFMLASVDEADIGQVRAMAPPEARPGADPSAATQPAAAMGNGGGNPNKPTSTQPTTQMVEQDTIEEDTEVTITVEAFPDDKFKGVIERIWPEAETRQAVATFQVRIRLTSENRDKVRHLVNMQAEAEFTSVPMKDVLLVPYEAVRRGPGDDLGVYVPVPKEDGRGERPKFVPCKFGPDNGIDVVVLKGVEDGQRIYTKLPIKTQREREAEEAEET